MSSPGDRAAPRSVGPRSRMLRRLVLTCWLLAALTLPALLAVAGGSRWWHYLAAEQTPMTWLQSVTLVLCAASCLWLAVLSPREHLIAARRSIGTRWVWLLLAVGFAGLAIDERFALHERLRDRILAPRGIRMPFLAWIGPGDFVLLVVGLIGLAILPLLYRALAGDPLGLRVFMFSAALSVIAIGMDSLDPARMSLGTERLEQTLEECVEFAAGLGYLSALTLLLIKTLSGLIDAEPTTSVSASPPAAAPAPHSPPR